MFFSIYATVCNKLSNLVTRRLLLLKLALHLYRLAKLATEDGQGRFRGWG